MNLQKMTGKINTFNFKWLLLLITFSLIATSFIYRNPFFFGTFILFFFISSLTTKKGLEIIKKLSFFQNIRDVGPSTHFIKINTPTIGGVFIIIPFLIFLLIINIKFYSIRISLLFFCIVGFFLIGIIDDFLSIKKQNNTGLKSNEKFILQSIIGLSFIYLAYKNEFIDPFILVSNNWGIDTNFMIIPICFLTLVGISNSVNLTDGLDGLAAGCSSIVFYGLGTEILLKGEQKFIIFSILSFSMCGLCLGFLKHNKYPAKIFMGDTGSLSIGAILGCISIFTNSFFTLFIISGIFIIESLSVIIQVGFFKISKKLFHEGKRVFLMAPLHHHYELKGAREEVIVANFWKVNILLVILGIVLKTIL